MAPNADLISADLGAYLKLHEEKDLLRFIACGSVDDGKSTLIGRLLYESKALFEDQLSALETESKKFGTQGENLDFALLVDGLSAEREQGITIDVAYRFFSTDRRKFIVADTPGHEQYTRNMATGASTADLAILLIDARRGVLPQTRRHSLIVSMLGVKRVALAVNKMDLVDWSQARFEEIRREYEAFAADLGFTEIQAIPVSALRGDNIMIPSLATPWHDGPTLLGYLESVPVDSGLQALPFRMAVQRVARPNLDFRGFCGRIASGVVRPGDRVRAMPSGVESRVREIVVYRDSRPDAVAGESVTLTLEDEIDVSRGDVLCAVERPAEAADRFLTRLLWMAPEPLQPGRDYLLKIGTRTVTATIGAPRYKIDVNTQARLAAEKLELNEIGVCEALLDRAIAFERYDGSREMGGFILIDRLTNATIAMGLIDEPLNRPGVQPGQRVDRAARAGLKGQRPAALWITGPSAERGSELAQALERGLLARGRHSMSLAEEDLRGSGEEGFRAAVEALKLMADAGLIVVAALPSPRKAERLLARDRMAEGEFVEIFLEGLETGAGYEAPEAPEIRLEAAETSPDQAAARVLAFLEARRIIP
ncbi:sulfate adenylyltransferase subunit CysN [Neomegalonema sp.]|uniref:sulfate adenylyltransferase subunit CysN n=1 Tax=Neomegalonema sp. TaxID=2039713 RepID=UPI00260FA9C3|nr:sulfate adenylyltransferase subunit CysN [Neomegalonema sp.]MDD2869227.1 sulfate adenylyltransferase subunit CysN [Neomegalonema sp.]